MTADTLSFPKLGLEFSLNPVVFPNAPFHIYWYGVILAVAFLAGSCYVLKRSCCFGLNSDKVMDVLMGGIVAGIVGARAYYVIFKWEDYKDNLLQIFNTRQGGLAIYGGIIGAAIACILIGRWRKVRLLPLFDLAAGGLLLGQAIGRWGNFVNMEAFGKNTTAPWGMTSQTISNYLTLHKAQLEALGVSVNPEMPVHPTFLYESLWCLLGFFVVLRLAKLRRFDGELGLFYLSWYGLGRAFIEGMRTDSLLIGTVRVSQILAIVCTLGSVLLWLAIRSKIKRANDPEYLKLFVDTPEGQAASVGLPFEPDKTDEPVLQEEAVAAEPENEGPALPEDPEVPHTEEVETDAAAEDVATDDTDKNE